MIHNETVNIWTHLLGFIFTLIAILIFTHSNQFLENLSGFDFTEFNNSNHNFSNYELQIPRAFTYNNSCLQNEYTSTDLTILHLAHNIL